MCWGLYVLGLIWGIRMRLLLYDKWKKQCKNNNKHKKILGSFSCSDWLEMALTHAPLCPFLYSADPLTSSLCQDLFRELSMGPSRDALQQRLIPTLVSIMNAPPEKVENDLPSLALDILTTLVRNSPPPLSELMLVQVPSPPSPLFVMLTCLCIVEFDSWNNIPY